MTSAPYLPQVSMPRFETVEEERRHRRQRLAATFRIFSELGLDDGTNGHVSARDPGGSGSFWTNPPGIHFSKIRVRDLLLVDATGRTMRGDCPVDEVQCNIHSRVLAARPDAVCVAHAHGVYGRAWSTQLRPLSPITQDACAFFDDQGIMDEYTGVIADPFEGDHIARALGAHKVVVLANHGVLTVGTTVDSAASWFVQYERACQIQLAAEGAAFPPRSIDDAMATQTAAVLGAELTAWAQFQPLFERIVSAQPDVLEE